MSSPTITVFYCLVLLSFCSLAFGQLLYGASKVGEACERDFHCINHAFCRSQLTCLCEPNYLPTPDFGTCIPTVGLICQDNAACGLMSNAECRQNVCACKDNFTVDITNSSNCLPRPMAENDRCQRNDECIDNLDRALCINNYCQCLTSHHYSLGSGKCERTAALFQGCESDFQCYMAELKDEADALVCSEGVCKCKAGNTSKHCNGASSNSATMLAAILFFLFARLFM